MSIKQFFECVWKQASDPMRIGGLIDAGAYSLRFGSNECVAREWAEFIAERQKAEVALPLEAKTVNPNICAVLYYDRDSQSEPEANTLYAWRFGKGKVRIGGTSEASLKAKGLTPDNYVVIFDEKHTTGGDIKQLPDRVNLLTYNKDLTFRTLAQAAKRARNLLLEQDLNIVVDRKMRKELYNGGATVGDLLISAFKEQVGQKELSTLNLIKDQVNMLTQLPAIQKIRQMIGRKQYDGGFAGTVGQLKPFFFSEVSEKPYEQFGRLKTFGECKRHLKDKVDRGIERFIKREPEADLSAMQSSGERLKKWIQENQAIPKRCEIQQTDVGLQQEVHQQVEQHREVKIEVEVETEIETELKRYLSMDFSLIEKEPPMTMERLKSLISAVCAPTVETQTVIPLCEQLKRFNYEVGGKKKAYETIFSAPLYGTKAFFYPAMFDKIVPIFHRLQRQPKQLLVCRTGDGGYRSLFLSEREAESATPLLQTLQMNDLPDCRGCWLIQPDGKPFVGVPGVQPLNLSDPVVKQVLFETLVLGGDLQALERRDQRTIFEEWLAGGKELKVPFLKLRALSLNDPFQKEALLSSHSIAKVCGAEMPQEVVGILCKTRLERERVDLGSVHPTSALEAKLLEDREQLKELHVSYLKHLGIDWNRRESDSVTKEALEALKSRNPGLDVTGDSEVLEGLAAAF
ncbi:MAG: hypothetical protein KDK40_03215, partial [Chlamydiia bacterium]|nr:hypothetical protein [Chlamydiia bacterium]